MQNSGIEVLFQGINFLRILGGLWVTVRIALVSIIIASLLGIVTGIIWTSKSKVINFICRLYLEVFRIIPILVWLYIIYFGMTAALNIHIRAEVVSIIIFSLWGASEMSDNEIIFKKIINHYDFNIYIRSYSSLWKVIRF